MIMIMIQNKVSTLNICLVRLAGYIASLLALVTNLVYPRGGGNSRMKGAGMLVVSLGLHVKKYTKIIYFQFVLFTRFMQFKFTTVSFRVKKKRGWTTIRLTFRFFIQISEELPRPFHMESPREYINCSTRQTLFSVNSSSC